MITTLRGPTLSLLVPAILLSGGAARSEEGPLRPGACVSWADAQRFAARSSMVVVARVAEAGQPSGKGWEASMTTDQASAVDFRQDLTVEVTETLFGQPPPPRKLIVQVRPLALPNALVMRMLRRIPGDRDMYPDEGMRVPRGAGAIPVRLGTADFAMSAGKTCVLFLRTAELPQSGGESQAPVAEHTAEAVPLEEPDAALLASLRAFCRASADWTRPPELPAEEDTQVKALVADLGSEDFGKREQAEAALNAKGARVRLYVEAAAQDRDAERAFRAKVVLQTIQPVPGNFRPPGRGGGNKS